MARFKASRLTSDPAERTRFLAALRTTGTIHAAAAETGVSVTTVGRLRKRDAGFNDACAIVVGNPTGHMLEAALIFRAIHGVPRSKTYANGTVETWTEYDNKLAWDILGRLMGHRYGDAATSNSAAPVMSRAEFLTALAPFEALDRADRLLAAPPAEDGG